ncbi:protein GET1-like [Impatiens glandulifera]|uniref:protein GET1-like n=1 Tax=Impatiens glandulifera TaxID=253017 RepID=UPI001FB150F3|nr:protein GET1-like [Impatiens glandulifera]
MGENMEAHGRSLAAPIIFFTVVSFQIFAKYIERNKKRGMETASETQLRAEIKQLHKEASSYSQPSTFAQAAKLRRTAAARERDLAKIQESRSKELKSSYYSYSQALTILKVFIYFVMVFWFWRVPIAAVPRQLVEPFGKLLSWRAGPPLNDNLMVGIVPWLIVSTRVGKILTRRVIN